MPSAPMIKSPVTVSPPSKLTTPASASFHGISKSQQQVINQTHNRNHTRAKTNIRCPPIDLPGRRRTQGIMEIHAMRQNPVIGNPKSPLLLLGHLHNDEFINPARATAR